LTKKVKDAAKNRMELDNEMRNFIENFKKESSNHLNNTLYLAKDTKSEEERRRRHEESAVIDNKFIEAKKATRDALIADVAA